VIAQRNAHFALSSDENALRREVIHFAYSNNDARIIKFENRPATRRYRGIPYMNDFQSVKKPRDGARNSLVRDDHATVPGTDFIGKSRHLTYAQRGAIPLCSRVAGLASVSSFIRWENVGCNVIYLPRANRHQSIRPRTP
jgi:hypothetical protein